MRQALQVFVQMRSMRASDGSIYWLKQASRRAVEIDGEVGISGVVADDVHGVPVGIEVHVVRTLGGRGVGDRDARG